MVALTIASLAVPSLAHAKRLFGGVKPMPRTSVTKAPKPPVAPVAPAAAKAPAAAVAPAARSPSMLGTVGAVAVGAAVGTMAGGALAGSMSPDKDTQAKETKALAAEKEAKELQRQADEAKRRADAARAAVQ
ncbi:hypothetical protein BLL52_0487 [Rhodoferax antarcticus ANT.BR]|uniref:ABC transporter substrate-binding protein n=1 Tax=Rhodoferax antarcticus ANT.BR TaxID=1111071 RepID=A0A1Q8YJU3_9BURK|nr:hypothetical protein BLL52_0487 [Rhodoferax antarcticus ANT.BR]